jgi:hypothetical protein
MKFTGMLCPDIPNCGCNAILLAVDLATLPQDVTHLSWMFCQLPNCKGWVVSTACLEGSGLTSVSRVCILIEILMFYLCSFRVILQIRTWLLYSAPCLIHYLLRKSFVLIEPQLLKCWWYTVSGICLHTFILVFYVRIISW